MRRVQPLAAALALAACALVLTACGGDGDTTVINTTVVEGSTDSAAATTTTATVTEDDGEPEDGGADDDADDDGGTPVSLTGFRTPTGNIGCVLSAKSVRCDILEKDWTAPRPAGCPGSSDFGQGLTLPATGPATVVCAGDTVIDPSAPVLEYGTSSQVGEIICESEESELECSNQSGGSFSLSRAEFDLN